MDIVSFDPQRPGVFAFGQEAYGIVAVGQMACGVVALGQIAQGVVAVGQVAVGLVAFGQAAIGALWGGAMIGVVGRGLGGVLQILPKIRIERYERPRLPPLNDPRDFETTRTGWLLARIRKGDLTVDGMNEPPVFSAEARAQLADAVAKEHNFACLTIQVEERADEPVGAYREAAPRRREIHVKRLSSWYEGPRRMFLEGPLTGAGGLLLRGVGAAALITAWWVLAGSAVLTMLSGW